MLKSEAWGRVGCTSEGEGRKLKALLAGELGKLCARRSLGPVGGARGLSTRAGKGACSRAKSKKWLRAVPLLLRVRMGSPPIAKGGPASSPEGAGIVQNESRKLRWKEEMKGEFI